MKPLLPLCVTIVLAGCDAPAAAPTPPAPASPASTPPAPASDLPRGATVGAGGYPTILYAPAASYPGETPGEPTPVIRGPDGRAAPFGVAMHMEEAGVDFAEASRRVAQSAADRPEANLVAAQLRARERGNYAGRYLQRTPTLAHVFNFKREPAGTLAKYTKNPRFLARQVGYTTADLDRINAVWSDRFKGLAEGWGAEVDKGVTRYSMLVPASEFRLIAARNKWVLPSTVALDFPPEVGPPVSPAAARFVRIFPRSRTFVRLQIDNAITGPITLRDGCLFVGASGEPPKLAYFARQMSLFVDDEGYLALRNQLEPDRGYGRVGERFVWSGRSRVIADPAIAAPIRAACGNYPVVEVPTPASYPGWRAMGASIGLLAERRGVTRATALKMWRQCWAEEDAAYRDAQLGRSRGRPEPVPFSSCQYDTFPVPPPPPPPPAPRR